jgi:phosphoglycerate dehydrogenase-like enzyme
MLCSSFIAERFGDDIAAASPGVELLTLDPDQRLPDDQVQRITIAYFSGDVWRGGPASFMRVALDAAELQWLHVFNAGVDHPVFAAFRDRGVRLSTSSGSSATPIAHTVIMQLLNLVRDSPRWWREQQTREWQQRDVADVEGRLVGVVGMGAIGREVARLAVTLGMRVIGIRRSPTGDEPCETWPVSRLDELLGMVDDLVLAAPLTADTHGLLDARRIGLLPAGAHVVNVGRGELIDEPALVEALRGGHLGGAALDVFATEPLPADSPLWALPNVIVTPHSAGSTELSRHRASLMFVANLARFTAGEPLHNEVS